jgi:glycosyltransferase involved in cell wall biosynthesis
MARTLQDKNRHGSTAAAAAQPAMMAMPVTAADDAAQGIGAPPVDLSDDIGPSNGRDSAAIAQAPVRDAAATSDLAIAGSRAGRTLQGHIEADWRSIKGWVWDPTTPAERIRLELLDGDTRLATTVANENRPGLILSGIGDGRYGFTIELAERLLPQERHVLHLRCADSGAEVPGSPIVLDDAPPAPTYQKLAGPEVIVDRTAAARTEPSVADKAAFAPTVQPVGDRAGRSAITHPAAPQTPLRAYIDAVSDTDVRGWVMRPDQPSHRCLVALKEGDRVLARAVASRFRADLVPAGIGDGCHCFALPMPRSVLDGDEHLLEIIEEDTGFPLTAKPIRWRSAAGTGRDALTAATRFQDVAFQPEAEFGSPIGARSGGDNARLADTRWPVASGKTGPRSAARVTTRILFDISDLVYYLGHHPNLTGIQRVQSSIVLAMVTAGVVPQHAVAFLSFNARSRKWVVIPTGFLISLLEDLFLPEAQRLVAFSADEARYGVLPGAINFDGAGLLDGGVRSVLCLLGAAWVQRDYFQRVLALKRQYGTRFVMTVHDLIPIYARETCDQDTARVFEEFMRRALRHADHVLAVSENTAKDLRRYVGSLSLAAPPITVTKNGSSFEEFLPKGGYAGETGSVELPERFVLFVATVEGRKNHRLMLDILRRMVEAGDDPPSLVCVGRLGWKSEAFIAELVETSYLNGRVILLQEISDAHLQLLYNRCLFTVCPSFYEGWGLPVGESLAAGKVCVCSDRASLPEVAGDLGVYIDIDDPGGSLAAIRRLIVDRPGLKRLEAKIRRDYKPVAWRSVAQKVVAACETAAVVEWREPYPHPAIPYSTEVSFAWLGRDVDGIFGDDLMARIVDARRGHFLREPLREQSFLWGQDARSTGIWAEPENWGTWLCHSGGEIVLGLGPSDSQEYYVFLRLRASGPLSDLTVRLSANGDPAWHGSIGPRPKNIVMRVRKKGLGAGGWRLHLRAEAQLSVETRQQIAALDSRVPTIGFERLVVVPDDDLKTQINILYSFFCD